MRPLPAATHIASVHLHIADLKRSLGFYRDLLGLRVVDVPAGHAARPGDLDAGDGRASCQEAFLSATGLEPALLRLTQRPGAGPRPRRAAGLFHVAWRAPNRAELGRWLQRLVERRYPLQGASDHAVSEALYLADPDGLGVELYVDRPRHTWPRRGRHVAMGSEPLDTAALLAAGAATGPWKGAHEGTDVGHVHLCVSSLEAAEAFYVEVVGLEVMQRDFPGALFLAAGGYHHHLAVNTWHSAGAGPAPDDAVGLRSWTLAVPDDHDVAALRQRLQGAGATLENDDEALTTRDGDGIRLRVVARCPV